jgi:hypothetical protein
MYLVLVVNVMLLIGMNKSHVHVFDKIKIKAIKEYENKNEN